MMIKMLLRPLYVLVMVCILPIVVIQAQPHDDTSLRAFLAPPEGCPAPCFMGIRPGVTSTQEAITLLRNHDWVEVIDAHENQVDARGRLLYGSLTWSWSDAVPAEIDSTEPGRLFFNQPDPFYNALVVHSIQIHTRIRTFRVQEWFGQPDYSMVSYQNRQLRYAFSYFLEDVPAAVMVSTRVSCPANLLNYWDSYALITMTTPYTLDPYTPFTEIVRLC